MTDTIQTIRARWYAPRLDAVRFCAFALVFLGHNIARSTFLPHWIATNTSPTAIFGVLLFFVLSAYLLGRLLLLERENTGSLDVGRYWARRILRIWPLYFFIVLGVYLVGLPHAYQPTTGELRYFLTFTENWSAPIHGDLVNYLGAFWTVCLEEQVYLILPVLLLCSWKRLPGVLSGLMIIGPVSCLVVVNSHAYPAVWNFTLPHLDSFGIGLLMALADTRGQSAAAWQRVRAAVSSTPGAAVLAVLTAAYFILGGLVGPSFTEGYPTAITFVTGSLLAGGWVLLASGTQPITNRVTRKVAWLGRRGYGLYAWHWPVLLLVVQVRALGVHDSLETPVGMVVSGLATLGLATASYRYLEMPFLRLRLRFQIVGNRV